MKIEIPLYHGLGPNSMFCWVCGKVGTKVGGWLTCYRHPEGPVQWSAYEVPVTPVHPDKFNDLAYV